MQHQIDGLTAADMCMLSSELWSFLGMIMTDSILPRRQALAAGEEQNGFELWRVLYWDHEGGAQHCQIQGVRQFMASPHCKDMFFWNAHGGMVPQ